MISVQRTTSVIGRVIRRAMVLTSPGLILLSVCLSQPKLVLDKKEIDLGTAYNGAIVKAKVKVTNGGNSPLMIRSVRTSCGCTTVREPKKELPPGDSDYLEVQFNSAGFRGKAVKYVNIESNDPANQYETITFTTEVKEELEPTNRVSLLWFGDVHVGKEMHLTYTLRNISTAPITIKKVKKVYPKLTVSYDKRVIPPSDSVVVTVSVVPDRIGYFNEAFTLETDSKNQPQVPIRVSYVGVKLQ